MAKHRHKREADARRKPRATLVAAPLAVLATVSAVGVGVLASDPVADRLLATQGVTADISSSLSRGEVVSRSGARLDRQALRKAYDRQAVQQATIEAVREADTPRWTTAPLNLWSAQGDAANKLGELAEGKKVLLTGRTSAERVEIVIDGKARWVTAGYLAEEKPVAGIGADCTNGSSVSSGVSANIKKVHQAVCAAFPELTSYGTFRGDGEHAQGIAIDIMVSGSRGWQVAEFVREHYAELGVSYVIYAQKIWSVQRGGEGWRGMSSRGSATANHYDHVHVTTY